MTSAFFAPWPLRGAAALLTESWMWMFSGLAGDPLAVSSRLRLKWLAVACHPGGEGAASAS